MTAQDDKDILGLKLVGAAVADARETMGRAAVPGISTAELDRIGAEVLAKHGARSAPQLAYKFPAATCISLNDELAHGIASEKRELRSGDLVNIDVSAEKNGYWADTGASFIVGEVSATARQLVETTRDAISDAIATVRHRSRRRDIGKAVERRARQAGLFVIEELAGHGVGRHIHEDPSISNLYDPTDRYRFVEGQVFTIEPFLTLEPTRILEARDGWTLQTSEGCLGAQFEHTVIVTQGRPLVITA